MDSERGAFVTIGEEQYELILTTRATKLIAQRYGGMDKLGEQLLRLENTADALDEVVWLIVTLANQAIMAGNLKKQLPPRELLTDEAVELLTMPTDLVDLKNAILDACVKGTVRTVESEPEGKNSDAG
ncbi:hypothetical protein FACS1894184_14880 [Clostridia bacterium]|nr:hypothetical protein FACS1894184_14880 [Clostridia bacterium]